MDIDYEYFLDGESWNTPIPFTPQPLGEDQAIAQRTFLDTLTRELRRLLPAAKKVFHAPMDSTVFAGDTYYRILQTLAADGALDALYVQYYNGPFRMRNVGDGSSRDPIQHYRALVTNIFGGNASKVLLGMCISDCSGTGSNSNAAEAADVAAKLEALAPAHGGVFFWALSDDVASNPVVSVAVDSVYAGATQSEDDEGDAPVAPGPSPSADCPEFTASTTSTWSGGYGGAIKVDPWVPNLEIIVDFTGTGVAVSNFWNSNVLDTDGSRYHLRLASWNSDAVGYTASGVPSVPVVSCVGDGADPAPAPVPAPAPAPAPVVSPAPDPDPPPSPGPGCTTVEGVKASTTSSSTALAIILSSICAFAIGMATGVAAFALRLRRIKAQRDPSAPAEIRVTDEGA